MNLADVTGVQNLSSVRGFLNQSSHRHTLSEPDPKNKIIIDMVREAT